MISIVFSKKLINEEHLSSLISPFKIYTMLISLLHHQAESENDTLVTQYSFIKEAWHKQSAKNEKKRERKRDKKINFEQFFLFESIRVRDKRK